jgi:putative ABC transport system ATP-binding protein
VRDIAVAAHHLSKTYGTGDTRVVALDDVSVEVETGRLTAVTGASGSGKSTLLHVLAGLDSVDDGEILLGGTRLTGMKDSALTRLRRDRIGFVFQSFNLLPMLTAAQNILLPLDLAGRRPDQERFDALVETFGLGARLDHLPSQLSGGQQQRVAIARALVTGPDVVFADEPTGALDSATSADVMEVLRTGVDRFGQTIVMVTHDEAAAGAADRRLELSDGRILADSAAQSAPASAVSTGAVAEALR